MGVRINGVWHEELADPGPGTTGTNTGNGTNFSSPAAYSAAVGSVKGGMSPNVNTTVGGGSAAPPPVTPIAATNNSNGTYSITTPDGGTITGAGTAPASLVKAVTDYYTAIQTGNKAAADEAIRQFNLNYGLAQSAATGTLNGQSTLAGQLQAANIAAQQAALTGTYNGSPTLAAQKQASDLAQQNYQQGITTAGLTGTYQGAQTQAAQQQAFAQAQANAALLGFNANGQATLQEQQLGLDALKAQSAFQNDPFRQQQYLYGLGAGGYSRAIDAMNGTAGFAASQAAQGPSAAGTNSLGYLGSEVAKYDPSHMASFYANTMGNSATGPNSPMGTGTSTYNASLNALPNSPNQILWRNFNKADPTTQNFITSGMSAKTGLDQATVASQIKATQPGFTAPSFGLSQV